MNYLMNQFYEFNVIMFLLIVSFNVVLSHSNITRLLKLQSQEIYNQFEEIKDEIRETKS